jgi:ribosomal protein S25
VKSRQKFVTLCSKLAYGRESVKDDKGRAKHGSLMREDSIARVKEHIQTDRRVTLRRMVSDFGLSYGIIKHSTVEILQ